MITNELDIKAGISVLNANIVHEIDLMLDQFRTVAIPNEYFMQAELYSRLRAIPRLNRPYKMMKGSVPASVLR